MVWEEKTANLGLPLLVLNQTGKEVVHNEALVILDSLLNNGALALGLNTPPEVIHDGDAYIVGETPEDEWFGHTGEVAYYYNGWRFIKPKAGLTLWVESETALYVFTAGAWQPVTTAGAPTESHFKITAPEADEVLTYDGNRFVNGKILQYLEGLGVNSQPDVDNKFTVNSEYVLFNNGGQNSRVKINKASSDDTASFIFQDNWIGRAEFGLMANDNITFKVSEDGLNWQESFAVDSITGVVDFKRGVTVQGVPLVTSPASTSAALRLGMDPTTLEGLDLTHRHVVGLQHLIASVATVWQLEFLAEDGTAVPVSYGCRTMNCQTGEVGEYHAMGTQLKLAPENWPCANGYDGELILYPQQEGVQFSLMGVYTGADGAVIQVNGAGKVAGGFAKLTALPLMGNRQSGELTDL